MYDLQMKHLTQLYSDKFTCQKKGRIFCHDAQFLSWMRYVRVCTSVPAFSEETRMTYEHHFTYANSGEWIITS